MIRAYSRFFFLFSLFFLFLLSFYVLVFQLLDEANMHV